MHSRDAVAMADDLPQHEAIRLLMAAADVRRSDVLLGFEIDESTFEEFESLVAKRRSGKPLQYLEGTVPFGPVELHVDSRVLIPRPETEYMFEIVSTMVDDPKVIVDLCTGSGNLALALAAEFPNAQVFATDLSADAVAVAQQNSADNGLDVDIRQGDLFSALPDSIAGRVDLIVANPPYLAASEVAALPNDVKAEPIMALVAGERGDEILEQIAAAAGDWLAQGGLIMCEISEFQSEVVAEHFDAFDPTILQDLTGRDRYVVGTPVLR